MPDKTPPPNPEQTTVEIGKKNLLRVVKRVDFGFYLDGDDLGEILIPMRYVPNDCTIGETIEVFIYLDSEDRIIATSEMPYAEVGTCAHLKVVEMGNFGAFLDWGLPKDLLVPFKEQRVPMQAGRSYTVFLFLDVTGRIAASSKLNAFLTEENKATFAHHQEVDLQIAIRSELGYKAVINGTHLGIIHSNEIFQPIHVGDQVKGYIKNIRADDRINLTLQRPGLEIRDSLSQKILDYLKSEGGSSTLTDKSPPEAIYNEFGVSKANYKKALGKLYKEKQIILEKDIIKLP